MWFWLFLFIMWWVLWRPGMVQWWREYRRRKADLQELERIHCVDDMFKENR
jgi:hypothetical protein